MYNKKYTYTATNIYKPITACIAYAHLTSNGSSPKALNCNEAIKWQKSLMYIFLAIAVKNYL